MCCHNVVNMLLQIWDALRHRRTTAQGLHECLIIGYIAGKMCISDRHIPTGSAALSAGPTRKPMPVSTGQRRRQDRPSPHSGIGLPAVRGLPAAVSYTHLDVYKRQEAYKPEFSSTATDFRVILKNVNYHHGPSIIESTSSMGRPAVWDGSPSSLQRWI